jgi:NADH dehydrogenase
MRVVVIGGGYAGVMAANRSARAGLDVVLLEPRDRFLDRIRLHEAAVGRCSPWIDWETVLASGVRRVPVRAIGLDVDGVTDATGTRWSADRVVLATGSVPDLACVPGAAEHALSVDEHLEARLGSSARIAVVGAGLTGIEVACELAATGREVVLYGPLVPGWSEAARAMVLDQLDAWGVPTLDEHVRGVRAGAVELASGEVRADAVIWAAGLVASPVARALGLACGPTGRARVDGSLRSVSHPWVRVAGDAAGAMLGGSDVRMSCAAALPMGAQVGDALAAEAHGRELGPFSFGWFGRCLALGPGRAVFETTDRWDRPTYAVGGSAGAMAKAAILGYVRTVLRVERLARVYRWPAAPSEAA